MCNFVIRPIKSYATVDVALESGENNDITQIQRGDAVEVSHIVPEGVVVRKEDKTTHIVPLATFIHSFTATSEDVKRVKDEEAKWFSKSKTETK